MYQGEHSNGLVCRDGREREGMKKAGDIEGLSAPCTGYLFMT